MNDENDIVRDKNHAIKYAIWKALRPILKGVFGLVWISPSTSQRWKEKRTKLHGDLIWTHKRYNDSQTFIKKQQKFIDKILTDQQINNDYIALLESQLKEKRENENADDKLRQLVKRTANRRSFGVTEGITREH